MARRTTTKFTSALIKEAIVGPFFRALWDMKQGRMPSLPPREQTA